MVSLWPLLKPEHQLAQHKFLTKQPDNKGAFMTYGRLSLQQNKPIMVGDDISSSTVYYVPFNQVGTPLSISVSSYAAGKNLDIIKTSGGLAIDDVWTDDDDRSVADPVFVDGIYENGNGDQYLGSVRISEAGVVKWQPHKANQAFGGAAQMGVFNAHNRVLFHAYNQDTASNEVGGGEDQTWQYGGGGIRYAHNSYNNHIAVLDGLGDATIYAEYEASYAAVSGTPGVTIGAIVNAHYGSGGMNFENSLLSQGASNSNAVGSSIIGSNFKQRKGFYRWHAIENVSNAGVARFYGNNFNTLHVWGEV